MVLVVPSIFRYGSRMLYNSYANVKAKEFANYKVPKRTDTVHWEGVTHQDLVKTVKRECKARDLVLEDENYQLANQGHTLFASWDFTNPVPGMKGMNMSLGYRGSNMGRYAHTFAVGARVLVCQNGMISGEFSHKRKHTNQVDLKELIGNALDRYLVDSKQIKQLVRGMRDIELTDDEASSVMMESARRGIVAWSRIRIVDEGWRKPAHKAFKPRNAWSLYNAFTESAKVTTPAQQIEIFRDIPALITDVCSN